METVMTRRIITFEDVKALEPCTNPAVYVTEDWKGSFTDLLSLEQVPYRDRIWAVTGLLDDKTNRLFAVWCARECLKDLSSPIDHVFLAACQTAEDFAYGRIGEEALLAAYDAANPAANYAAYDAASDAAYSTAYSTASDAAYGAACSAAFSGSSFAARNAIYYAQIEQLKVMVKDI